MSSKTGICVIAVIFAIGTSSASLSAQGDRGQDRDRDQNRNRAVVTRLDPGMTITVRSNDAIDAARTDYRVYNASVDQDVRADNGRVAIPRGSTAELIVRNDRNGDLILDLESVSVDGRRYAVQTNSTEVGTDRRSNDIVGAVVGAIRGGDVRGRAVRIPRGTVMGFRLERALDVDVPDRGVTRDGRHYHDYYGRGGRGGDR